MQTSWDEGGSQAVSAVPEVGMSVTLPHLNCHLGSIDRCRSRYVDDVKRSQRQDHAEAHYR